MLSKNGSNCASTRAAHKKFENLFSDVIKDMKIGLEKDLDRLSYAGNNVIVKFVLEQTFC
jgi:hypothetical protein